MRPDVGWIIRLTIRSDVVLPQPDGPTSTVIWPLGATRSSPPTATVPSGYFLVTLSKRIIAPTQPHRRPLVSRSLGNRRDACVPRRKRKDPTVADGGYNNDRAH
jgi:hypothetical protein